MRWVTTLQEDPPVEGEQLISTELAEPMSGAGRFHAVIAVEDVWSGDGRQFTTDSLSWRELPLPLMALDTTTEYHNSAILVGNFDKIERVGSELHGWGAFITDPDVEAADLITRVQRGELRGVSADVDAVEYELLLPDTGDEAGFLLFADDTPPPEETPPPTEDPEEIVVPMSDPRLRITEGRIMGATVCPFPAMQECYIEPDTGDATLVASATPTHHTGISDGPWDGAAQEAKLPSPLPLATMRAMYAWYDPEAVGPDDTIPKASAKLPHHEVGDNNAPGVANTNALSAAMAALHGGRGGGVSIPEGELKSVYDHLAAHYTDNNLEPPAFSTLTAAAAPTRPPLAWFNDPRLEEATPLTIGDDGRVWGHVATWDQCHLSFPDHCVPPPHTRADYAYYRTGEVATAEGPRVAVGQICVRGGHADRSLSAQQAMAHYDDTDSAVADVTIGEDRIGIWIAGAVRPEATPGEVRRLMASGISPDWRRIGSNLELIALSSVNVPGFPQRRALIREVDGLVASAIVDLAPVVRREVDVDRVIERIAMSIGRGREQRIAELNRRVHPSLAGRR